MEEQLRDNRRGLEAVKGIKPFMDEETKEAAKKELKKKVEQLMWDIDCDLIEGLQISTEANVNWNSMYERADNRSDKVIKIVVNYK